VLPRRFARVDAEVEAGRQERGGARTRSARRGQRSCDLVVLELVRVAANEERARAVAE